MEKPFQVKTNESASDDVATVLGIEENRRKELKEILTQELLSLKVNDGEGSVTQLLHNASAQSQSLEETVFMAWMIAYKQGKMANPLAALFGGG